MGQFQGQANIILPLEQAVFHAGVNVKAIAAARFGLDALPFKVNRGLKSAPGMNRGE